MAHSVTSSPVREIRRNAKPTNSKTPRRPAPTPEQAALGIRPPIFGNGTSADIDALVQTFPPLGDEEFEAFQKAISDNRADRRAATVEQVD